MTQSYIFTSKMKQHFAAASCMVRTFVKLANTKTLSMEKNTSPGFKIMHVFFFVK